MKEIKDKGRKQENVKRMYLFDVILTVHRR